MDHGNPRLDASQVETKTQSAEEQPKCRSRYRKTRPMQAPQSNTTAKSSARNALQARPKADQHAHQRIDYSNAEQQEAYRILTGGEVDRRPSVNEVAGEEAHHRAFTRMPLRMKPHPTDHHQLSSEHDASHRHQKTMPMRELSEQLLSSPEHTHDSRPSTAKSGNSSWSSLREDSLDHSQSKFLNRTFYPPPNAALDAPLSSSNTRHITVQLSSDSLCLPTTPSTTASDVLALAAQHRSNFDPATSLLTESLPTLGLERPIRPYERIYDVLESWDYEGQHDFFILTPDSLSDDEASSAKPSSLSPSIPSRNHPAELRLDLKHLNKSGKWSESTVILREDGQVIISAGKGDGLKIGHMSDFDGYIVRGRQRRAVLGKSKGRKRYVVAIKSQQKAARFETKEDYIHFFAGGKDEVRRWWDGVREWRAWYLAWERGLAFPKGANADGKDKGKARLPRSATVHHSEERATEKLPRSRTTRKASAKAGGGLVSRAQNADTTVSAVATSTTNEPIFARSSGERRSEEHEDGKPLVDLTMPSAFQKGSLLAVIEAKEQEARKAREGPKGWK
jgi:hypothetical protein